MARKIRFRKQRLYHIKIFIVILLFIGTVTAGLIAVDINKSCVFYGESRLELVQIESMGNDLYNIYILNDKFTLNLKYLNRDFRNIKSFFHDG